MADGQEEAQHEPLADPGHEHARVHGLPFAMTDTDKWLLGIHQQVVGLRADFARLFHTGGAPGATEDIELKEPAGPAAKQSTRRK